MMLSLFINPEKRLPSMEFGKEDEKCRKMSIMSLMKFQEDSYYKQCILWSDNRFCFLKSGDRFLLNEQQEKELV